MSAIQLKVSLTDTKPLIWRRILVPADASAYELHHMIQLAMGWRNHHLFQFNHSIFQLDLLDDYGQIDEEALEEMKTVTVEEMADSVRTSFTYLYDMGDHWLHRVTVEEFLDKEIDHAIVLEGEKACPPEDCGGVGGYYELLAILKNKFNKERLEKMKWLDEYNPGWEKNKFDIDKANENLKNLKGWLEEAEKE